MQLSWRAGKCLKNTVSPTVWRKLRHAGLDSTYTCETANICNTFRASLLLVRLSQVEVACQTKNTNTRQVAACSLSSCPTFWWSQTTYLAQHLRTYTSISLISTCKRSIIMTTGMTKQGWRPMSLRVGKPSAQNMLLYCLTPQDSMSRLQRIHMCNSAPLSLNLLQKSWKWRTISVSKQGSHWSEGPPASSPRAPPVKSKKWGHTQIWDVPTAYVKMIYFVNITQCKKYIH